MSKFGWSLPAGCTTLPGDDDEPQDNSLLEEAFGGNYECLYDLYRTVYKHTACGPSVGAYVSWWDTGSIRRGEWFWCSSLRELGTWADMRKAGKLVEMLAVSSIVEGVDQTTDTVEVDVQSEDDLHAAFFKAVGEVSDEASSIWHETHGCPECAKHWREQAGESVEDWKDYDDDRWQVGDTQVWVHCPKCDGDGAVI